MRQSTIGHFRRRIESTETPQQAAYRREQEREARAGKFVGWWPSDGLSELDEYVLRLTAVRWFLGGDGGGEVGGNTAAGGDHGTIPTHGKNEKPSERHCW
jgi:hypothetical protein